MKKAILLIIIGYFIVVFVVIAVILVVAAQRASAPREEGANTVVQESKVENVQSAGENMYWITNPTSGSALYATVFQPQEDTHTAIVLVPGGSDDADIFLTPKFRAQTMADSGYTVVIFDPEGRGKSEGIKDKNGTIGQDGLNAVVNFASTLEGIDQVGIVSFSYGATMASGMLARYPNSPALFLVDWEGPADRNDTGGCDGENRERHQDVDCFDEAYWSEREADTFIGAITVPYQRIQTEKDHVQSDYGHTVAMVHAAVEGTSPWVRLNDDAPNQTYTEDTITPLSEDFEKKFMLGITEYVDYLVYSVLPALGSRER